MEIVIECEICCNPDAMPRKQMSCKQVIVKNFECFSISEILDCMNVSDESFTELVLLLSDSQKIENKISEIKSKFTSTSSAIRSQANLFNHKNGLLYNTSRELLGEHTVAIYKPELKELPFGKRFIIAKIYVFSDSLIIEFTSDISTNISKDLLNIDISTIVTVKENPSTFFNSNDISSSFQKGIYFY